MSRLIEPARLDALSRGEVSSRTLQEILQINFSVLMENLAPDAPLPAFEKEGISRKMVLCGEALLDHMGPAALTALAEHPSDTVRGLSVFGLARHYRAHPIAQALEMVRPFASDQHFGVREWAWMAVRPNLIEKLDVSINALATWTSEMDVNLRRFAVEALRPRGVWCKHIAELRADPARGLPIVEPMRAEPERYAQDSVANWLNDAAKDHPDWVRALCRSWKDAAPANPFTKRIALRATRSIKK